MKQAMRNLRSSCVTSLSSSFSLLPKGARNLAKECVEMARTLSPPIISVPEWLGNLCPYPICIQENVNILIIKTPLAIPGHVTLYHPFNFIVIDLRQL